MNMNLFTLAADNPVDHVVNTPWLPAVKDAFGMHGVWFWSAHVGNLVLAGALTIIILAYAAKKIATGPESLGNERYLPGGSRVAGMIEVICVYLRDNSVKPLLGDRTDRFMPLLWTLFFFILINNLLGLAPITDLLHLADHFAGGHYLSGLFGATSTGNIFVTAALAAIAGIVINIAGVKELGLGGYLKHLTAGTPWYLWPIMIPIEILGTFIKPVALALRLFANMTAGHILIAVLLMFATTGLKMFSDGVTGALLGGTISLVSILATVAIYFLELFVAFLQAFVFVFLTTVFISLLAHHDHEHGDAHGHEHAHA
ncbi:MAG: ATP synthase F0 subunit A [Leptolyngbya sp. PLA1]|nr:ATP synthase F0 subunit A [Leptolyngbya sp. PLA1]